MVHTVATLASLMAAASMLSVSEAHTNMMAPAPKWPAGFYNVNSPFGRIDSTKFSGEAASIPGYQGVKKIAAAMGSGTLRDLVYKNVKITLDGATKECGKTLQDGAPVPVPDEIDFPWGHPGPCEAWCDNTKIYSNGDCMGNNVGKIKVDKSKCSGAKRLQVMYAGVHVENYEIYSNCVPLGAGGGAAASAGANSNTDAEDNNNSTNEGDNNNTNEGDNNNTNEGDNNNTNEGDNNQGNMSNNNQGNMNNNNQGNMNNNNQGNNNNNQGNMNKNNQGNMNKNNQGNMNKNNQGNMNKNNQGNMNNNRKGNKKNMGQVNNNNRKGNNRGQNKGGKRGNNGNRSYNFGSINNNGGNNNWGRGNRQLRD